MNQRWRELTEAEIAERVADIRQRLESGPTWLRRTDKMFDEIFKCNKVSEPQIKKIELAQWQKRCVGLLKYLEEGKWEK